MAEISSEYPLVYFKFCGLSLFYLLKKINCTVYFRKMAVQKIMGKSETSGQVLKKGEESLGRAIGLPQSLCLG